MKAPAFWYQSRGIQSSLLAPLGFLWSAAASVRRKLAKPYKATKPVICIGNLVTGGAGKTPTAIAIANLLLRRGHKPVFVLRGYGGSTRGPLQVDLERHSARDVGDEAMLLSCIAPVWIGRDRPTAIREAERLGSHIILDDGLQNPHIAPDVSLLVVDSTTGLGNGHVMPAGPLRETLSQALPRVSGVILIGNKELPGFVKRIKQPIVRAKVQSDLQDNFPRDAKFIAFAGIARPEKFYGTCAEIGLQLIDWKDFPDHHMFSRHELAELYEDAEQQGAQLLTTEKDYVRLPLEFRPKVIALPIKLTFDNEDSVLRLLNLLK